jgi:pseudaminic acid synthase
MYIKISTPKGERKIGPGEPCFIIAEMSGNHGHYYEKALKIIDAASEAGADAIKLQTYKGETITIDCDNEYFQIKDGGLWDGQTLYELYEKAHTPWDWQPKLKKYAESKGLVLFSSPFDITAVDFLEKMEVGLYKIASLEVVDIPLLERIGKTGKPVIMSRGTATLEDLKLAVKTLQENGSKEIAILQCVSSYPAKPEDMNLLTIPDLSKKFGVVSGLSDHSLGNEVCIAAVALGASIIEKHLTLSRADKEIDSVFSLEPEELKNLVNCIRVVEKARGKHLYTASKNEVAIYRKSLFAVKDIIKNEILEYNINFRSIRPGHGLEPKFYKKVEGMRAKKNINRGTPLSWELLV